MDYEASAPQMTANTVWRPRVGGSARYTPRCSKKGRARCAARFFVDDAHAAARTAARRALCSKQSAALAADI